jgi:hypothetical protein
MKILTVFLAALPIIIPLVIWFLCTVGIIKEEKGYG